MADKEQPKKGNTMRNTLRQQETPAETPPPAPERKKRPQRPAAAATDETPAAAEPGRKFRLFGGVQDRLKNDERLRKLIGAFLLFIVTPYLAVAFLSYFFTWKADQNLVAGALGDLFQPEVRVTNVLGKFGALVSHAFIHSGFGVMSFVIPLLSFVSGIRMLTGAEVLPFGKTFRYGIFSLLFGSVLMGYVFSTAVFYPGGVFGYEISNWLNGVFGKIGTGLFLIFIAAAFLIIVFNFSFAFKRAPKADEEEPETETAETTASRNEIRNKPAENPNTAIEDETDEELEDDEEVPEPLLITNTAADEPETEELEEEEEPEPVIETPAVAEIPPVLPVTTDLTADDNIQFTVEKNEEAELSSDEIGQKAEELVREFGEFDPTLELGSYQFPTIDLLENYATGKDGGVNAEELNANKNRIVETLGNYGIAIDKIKATIGPTVTLYEINPAAGVRISKIKNLEDDIALSLSALGIRIIAPIPGKGTIGIEVPNQHPEMVPMRALLASERFQNSNMDLPVALGKTISNEIYIADLAKMPHLLMAGATGQGKSVGLNAILVSLLYKKHPAQIKFVLVDPKKVELTLFNKIERHFLAKLPDTAEAIITDTKKVVHTLNSLCIEMDTRYDLLKDAQVRNIKEYNAKIVQRRLPPTGEHKFLPYIVLVVDEFADLIMTAGKEVETPIARLAQLARAVGIHLIIATQRPSVNIITGTIKANFPARIAFRVTSKIDSRTILDSGGAEQLIGRGDMLFSTGNDLTRLQCAFVDTPEVERICQFIGDQRGYPSAFQLPEYVDENSETKMEIDEGDRDSLFEEAARIIVNHQQGSASLLQRKLKLGYNRAGRIVDQLEAAGIIGPFEGSKAREVLVKDILSLEQMLGNRKGDNSEPF
ncbi:MAG: DNA translocase FtsK [Bacteroidota bacterium]